MVQVIGISFTINFIASSIKDIHTLYLVINQSESGNTNTRSALITSNALRVVCLTCANCHFVLIRSCRSLSSQIFPAGIGESSLLNHQKLWSVVVYELGHYMCKSCSWQIRQINALELSIDLLKIWLPCGVVALFASTPSARALTCLIRS